jgi:hypothetical protein
MAMAKRENDGSFVFEVISAVFISFILFVAVFAFTGTMNDYTAAYGDAKKVDELLQSSDREIMNLHDSLIELGELTDAIKADPARLAAFLSVMETMEEGFSAAGLNQKIELLMALKGQIEEHFIEE